MQARLDYSVARPSTSVFTRVGRRVDTQDSFKWKINNLTIQNNSNDSDRFAFELSNNSNNNIDWYLHCRLLTEHIQNLPNILDVHQFYLIRSYKMNDQLKHEDDFVVDYRIRVPDLDLNEVVSNFYPKGIKGNGIDYLKPVKSYRPAANRSNNTAMFTLVVYLDIINVEVIKPDLPADKVINGLSDSMTKFMVDGQFTDLTIVVENEKFQAHKMLLAAHSPVFESMFSQDMIEKRTNTVKINDISADVFKAFLHYVYLKPFNKIADFCDQLIRVADKYQVKVLKKFCEEHLIRSISLNNCLELLEIGDLSNSNTGVPT